MYLRRYLPSAQFTVIAFSLLFAGGLVYGAELITQPPASSATVSAVTTSASDTNSEDWQATLDAIQAQNASSSLAGATPQTVAQMLAAAQSSNITDSVGKSILINLSNAKSQGLGDDTPTQDQIISAAAAQVAATKPTHQYTAADLTIVADSNASLKAYGNGVMQILDNNQTASEQATLTAIDNATSKNDPSELDALTPIGAAYQNITTQLLALPVPQTLSPLHLSVVNAYASIAATYPDMQASLTDPLRGIVGIQTYEAQLQMLGRVFTNIAQDLSKDGILFNKDEPGSAWSIVLSPQ
ncbi:MAG TPA: hypothetical protein VMR46_02470 [Candidatus Paceibacterota bacterium]|nr:hypothetical protein [Candidatus Paceibacterota bacterium]